MASAWVAAILGLIAAAQITLVVVYWQVTRDSVQPFPHFISLACIGSTITLVGALSFAIAFFIGA
jgi:hypothetical protein